MHILGINNAQYNVGFNRKLNRKELEVYTKTVNQSLKLLDKELGIIIHNPSFPATKKENTGIGSIVSKTSIDKFVPMLKSHGFSSIQQEPDNLRGIMDISPYSPLTPSKNILMIPLEKLKTTEYGNILSANSFYKILEKNNPRHTQNINYKNVIANYDLALNEAYTNYKDKSKNINELSNKQKSVIEGLNKEFDKFKNEKSEQEIPYAIYEILARKNGNDNWRKWNNQDKNLFNTKVAKNEYLDSLKEKHKDDIEFYLFKQMLAEREIEKTKNLYKEKGIKIIGDSPIAFTMAEEWQHQDLFLDKLAIGCPPDFYSKDGQRWEFAVLNPEKMFNSDGTLGDAGKLLQKRYERLFESSTGGARIDHIIGLVDPFVYSRYENNMNWENSGRLYSSHNHPILGKYAKSNIDDYASVMEKIVIPAAEKFGLTKNDIICEDLGYVTQPVRDVMNKLNLSGINLTEFDTTGVDTPAKNVLMLGSHDNPSFIEFTNSLFNGAMDRFNWKTHVLASDTVKYNENVDLYREELRSDKKKYMSASFAELFASPAKRIQIFFTDFFGIGKTYNRPGAKEDCWSLRLSDDYEKTYHNNLKNGLGLNLPEVLSRAIKHKGEEFAKANEKLLEKLDNFANILKE